MQEYSHAKRCYLDFDFRRSPKLAPLWAVLRIVGIRPQCIRFDRTRRGWHAVLYLGTALQPAEIVALQSCCGSDRHREALNLMRVIAMRTHGANAYWQKRWNILYRGKL